MAFCRCRCPALARGFRGQRQTEDTAPHRISRACRRAARGIGPPWNLAARLRRLNPSARNSWGIAVEVERFVVEASRAWAAPARSRRQKSRAMHKRSTVSVLSACKLNHDRKHRFQNCEPTSVVGGPRRDSPSVRGRFAQEPYCRMQLDCGARLPAAPPVIKAPPRETPSAGLCLRGPSQEPLRMSSFAAQTATTNRVMDELSYAIRRQVELGLKAKKS